MSTSSVAAEIAAAKNVRVTSRALVVELRDGRVVSVPLAWYPRLKRRGDCEIRDHALNDVGQGAHVNRASVDLEFFQHPDLYDALLPVGGHLPFYVDLARQQAGSALEPVCGTGQLTVPIAAAGISTVGLDQSAATLDAAKRRAGAAGVSVDLVEGDIHSSAELRRCGFGGHASPANPPSLRRSSASREVILSSQTKGRSA